MDKFVLSKESHFILYGAASCGSLLCDKLLLQGYAVDAFIDRRAEEITGLKGIPVYKPEDAAEKFCGKETVVIISVKNVFEHSRIAVELAELGLQNILYKPYSVLKGKGKEEEYIIGEWYDRISEGNLLEGKHIIGCTKSSHVYAWDTEEYILDETDDMVTMSLPLICLFENLNQNETSQERNSLYFFPHIQFFQYLQGDLQADVCYYMSYCEEAAKEIGSFAITDAWKRNVIKNRTEICNEMNNSFWFEQNFFVNHAPYVIWNRKGYFNLTSGKHRTAFWASKKMMFIPVKMKKKEAELWLNKEKAFTVLKKMEQEKMYVLKAPVEHPLFYQYPCVSVLFFQGLVFKMAEMISRIYYSSPLENYVNHKKIYISADDQGFLSRYLRRCGAQVFEDNKEDEEWIQLLDELFYLKERNRISESSEYDIGIIQITDSKMEICRKIPRARHYFYIIPENAAEIRQELKCVYQGIAWNEPMCVFYQEAQDV